MHFQYISYVWLLLASAAVTAMLGVYAWHQRTTPGAVPFALLMLLAAVWALANALEMAGTDLPTKLFWANVQYLGYVALPLAWLALALQYTGREAWLTRRRLVWLSVEPLVTVVLAWTSHLHGLLRRNVRLDMGGPFPVIGKTFGPWFWVHAAYTYTLLAFTVYLLAQALRRPSSLYRRQTLVLLLGVLLPLISNALYNIGLSPIPRHDISPAVLCLSGAIVAWGLFRYRLFDIMPVAQDTVLEGMDDGIIVLDMGERIVDLNQAVQRMLGQPAATAIGQPLDRAFSAWPDLLKLSRDAAARRCESVVGVGAGQRQYSLRGLPLVDRRGRPVGRLIVLRDITDREQAEARLLEQGAALAALEERGRLARELHDGLGQVLGYVNVQTQATRELLASGRIVEADAYLERMAAVTQDAQADVRESILDLRVDLTPGQGLLPILEQCLARFERYYGISTEMVVREEAAVGAIEPGSAAQLLRIIQEALTNVRKHAHARSVRLTLSARAGEVEVVVEDDGRGLDLTAHAVALTGFGDQDSTGTHLGLRFMRERAESVGGVFQASSTPGQGTKVTVRVPLRPPSP